MGATVQQFKDMPVPVLEMAAISEIMPQGLAQPASPAGQGHAGDLPVSGFPAGLPASGWP